MSKSPNQYFWYMAGVTTFVIPAGIQTILFPWLIAVQLGEPADRLGIAQMCTQLPGLALILFGGLLADRVDPRKILIVFHVFAAMPAAALAVAIYFDQLSYPVMLVYALAMGTVLAFIQPARDTMLNRVAGDQLQRTVTVTMGLTFGAQIFGFIAASFTDSVGPGLLLLLQSCILLSGALTAMMLTARRPEPAGPASSRVAQIKDGLRIVFASKRMAPALMLMITMSLFYGGSFMVLNPVIVRDIYGGGALEISLSFGAFMIGTIATTVILVAAGGLRKQGRGLMCAMFAGGLCLLAAYFELPFYGYLSVIFLWGMGGGVAMSMGRTIMQESAPLNYRARVMSIFSLGSMGGMPIGALSLGYCATIIGPLASLLVCVAGVWLVLLLVWFFTDLANLEPLGKGAEPIN